MIFVVWLNFLCRRCKLFVFIVIVKGCRSSKERSPIYEVENGMKELFFVMIVNLTMISFTEYIGMNFKLPHLVAMS